MVLKAGDFSMGSPENESYRNNDEPRHPVSMSKPVYLGLHFRRASSIASYLEGEGEEAFYAVSDFWLLGVCR